MARILPPQTIVLDREILNVFRQCLEQLPEPPCSRGCHSLGGHSRRRPWADSLAASSKRKSSLAAQAAESNWRSHRICSRTRSHWTMRRYSAGGRLEMADIVSSTRPMRGVYHHRDLDSSHERGTRKQDATPKQTGEPATGDKATTVVGGAKDNVPKGIGSNATYRFHRAQGWLGRLEAIYSGEFTPINPNGPEWFVCVDTDEKCRAIEQFVNKSEVLRICADLSNGSKHFALEKGPRSGTTPGVRYEHTKIDHSTGVPIRTTRFALTTGRGEEDALELAKECIKAWDRFIRTSTRDSLRSLAERNRAAKGRQKK